jgi:hypothetical protein
MKDSAILSEISNLCQDDAKIWMEWHRKIHYMQLDDFKLNFVSSDDSWDTLITKFLEEFGLPESGSLSQLRIPGIFVPQFPQFPFFSFTILV